MQAARIRHRGNLHRLRHDPDRRLAAPGGESAKGGFKGQARGRKSNSGRAARLLVDLSQQAATPFTSLVLTSSLVTSIAGDQFAVADSQSEILSACESTDWF